MRLSIPLITLFLSSSLFSQNVSKKLSVLFLGNSYTYVNNLPQLLHDLALANNDTLLFDSNTPGGYTLQNHSVDAASIAKINSQKWDHVILQAQSQEPSIDPSTVTAQTTPYAIQLHNLVKNNDSCTITAFYETWGRKYGDGMNCGTYTPVCTYAGMQDRLKQSYKLFADSTKGIMVPAGEAFRLSRQLDSTIDLYQSDLSHPSLEGSYLTACVFYETLFHKSIVGNSYLAGLSSNVAGFLQQVAHTTVTDSLLSWNLGSNIPYAPFTFAGTNLQYQFNSLSGFTHYWEFGDGNSSTQSNPLHTYLSSQTYTISHTVENACIKDSSVQVILAGVSDIGTFQSHSLRLFPNPAKDFITIPKMAGTTVRIYSTLGVFMGEFIIEQDKINVAQLPSGCYFITHNKASTQKFIKE